MFQNYQHPRRVVPATIIVIIAAVLVFALYFQVRDRFLDPQIKTTEQAEHSTTGAACWRAALADRTEALGRAEDAENRATRRSPGTRIGTEVTISTRSQLSRYVWTPNRDGPSRCAEIRAAPADHLQLPCPKVDRGDSQQPTIMLLIAPTSI